jgi:hypothetical protein
MVSGKGRCPVLVHNFLHRSGILDRLNAGHRYGPICYQRTGCAGVLEAVAQCIDARTFNPDFPATFPRFVQHAIWRYCAQLGLKSATAIELMIAKVVKMYTVAFTANVTV